MKSIYVYYFDGQPTQRDLSGSYLANNLPASDHLARLTPPIVRHAGLLQWCDPAYHAAE